MGKKLLPLLLALALALECMAPAAFAAEPETPDVSAPAAEDAAADEDEPSSAVEEPPAVDEPEQASGTEDFADGASELPPPFTTVIDTWGGIAWSLTPEGLLQIFPKEGAADSGVMPKGDRPWQKYLTDGVDVYELIIHEGVTHISDYIFSGHKALCKAKLPESLTTIGVGAFKDCTALQGIVLPPHLESISENAFRECTALTGTLTIPDSCKRVGWSSFKGTAITQLNLGKGVEEIGASAFEGCAKLIGVTLPSSIKTVGQSAFAYCGTELVYINPTKGATTFGNQVFEGCKSLKVVIIDPNSITEIPFATFKWCDMLRDVTLPEGIKSIGDSAFTGCKALQEIELPNSLLTLGEYAFSSCASLESLTIPDKVREVPQGLFYKCNSLKTVVFGEQVTTIHRWVFDNFWPLNITLYYNLKSVEDGAFGNGLPLNVTFYGTEEEWRTLCSSTENNEKLTTANPHIHPIIHSAPTWGSENTSSVAEAAANRETMKLSVERPVGLAKPVSALAAAYDADWRMLGFYSCIVDKDGALMEIELPLNAKHIKIMMVDNDSTSPLLPAKAIT